MTADRSVALKVELKAELKVYEKVELMVLMTVVTMADWWAA